MTTIFVRDSLRASIEAATGGQNTVLYTRSGMPSFFFVLPKFNIEDIDPSLGSGPHPAFIVNGQEMSRLFIGQYRGISVPVDGGFELLSLPGIRAPHIIFEPHTPGETWMPSCPRIMNGPGYHLMTNTEWAAIMLWCQKRGVYPNGNTREGKCHWAPHEHGVVWDQWEDILTGSGPSTWRHNFSHTGISDLIGMSGEVVSGLRIVEGEIQVCQDNDAADWTSGYWHEKEWKAVDFASGNLVLPGTAGTVKVDSVGLSTGPFEFSATVSNRLSQPYINSRTFSEIDTGPTRLKLLGLRALTADIKGEVQVHNYGTGYAARGSYFRDTTLGENVGLGTLGLTPFSQGLLSLRIVKY